MGLIAAVRLALASPYMFARRHEWRGVRVTQTGLWPVVTLGWWTLDTLPECVGQRISDIVETTREPRVQQPVLI